MSRRGAGAAAMAAVMCALAVGDAHAGKVAFVSTRCDADEPTRMAFGRPAPCPPRVWRVDDDGTGLRRLTSTPQAGALAGEPVWSPEGTRIAYTLGGGQSTGPADSRLWVMNADGSDQHPLTPGGPLTPTRYSPGGNYYERTPAWSPTGLFLVFAVNDAAVAGDLFVVGANGLGYRRLTDTPEIESDPSFSPDGLSVLFTRRAGILPPEGEPAEPDGLYSLSLIDGKERRVTLGPSYEFAARYSPDGRRISYLDGSAVWTMTADGRRPIRRTDPSPAFGPGAAKPSWAGRHVLLYDGPGDDLRSRLQRLDVSGPGLAPPPQAHRLGTPPAPAGDQAPSWHPGLPVLPLPPLPDLVPPELGLVDVGVTPVARTTAARSRGPRAASRETLRYTAFDRSGVSRLQASVERKRGKRCRYGTRKGLGKPRTCRKPAYFRVGRREDWTQRLARLAPGSYRIRLRAWDARGNHVKYPRPRVVRLRR